MQTVSKFENLNQGTSGWFVTLNNHTNYSRAAEQFLVETEPSSGREEYKVFLGISVPGPLCSLSSHTLFHQPSKNSLFFFFFSCDVPIHSTIFPKAVFLLTPTWKDFEILFNK